MSIVMDKEQVRIIGRRGMLAAELAYGTGTPAFAALLVPPHPHMGGSMENNVIRHLAGDLPSIGGVTLRFDYAGVGGSEGAGIDVAASMAQFWQTGHAPEDPLMIDDAAAAQAWLARSARVPQVLIGYSFGSYAATLLAIRTRPRALILISPTISQHDFSAIGSFAGPVLVIYGDNDFATPQASIEHWLKVARRPIRSHCIHGGEHFFLNHEAEVAAVCRAFIQASLTAQEAVA